MSLTLQRLQALKRQAGGSAPVPRPSIGRSVIQDVEQLRRTLKVRARLPTQQPARHVDRSLPGEEIAPGLWLIESHLPNFDVPAEICGAFDRRAMLETRSMLFFDTETTGLAGGVGTRAFMIGAAHWQNGGLVVRQLLTATLGAERIMLEAFREWLAPDTTLVSYNGKCYDAPLLRARLRLARLQHRMESLEHVDLLFPTRRRYKGVWENCRLGTIERNALQIVREDDLPGSEAPGAWLGYLRGGSSSLLKRVAAHNHQDVITLARLVVHLSGT